MIERDYMDTNVRGVRKMASAFAVLAGVTVSSGSWAYESVEVENAGKISGVVRLEGEAPEREQLEVTRDEKVCGPSPKLGKSLIVSNGNVVNAVVSIKEIDSGKAPKKQKAVINQQNCEYIPHVLAVGVGQAVEILNSDGILHNIHSYSEVNQPFNKAMPKFRKSLTVNFSDPEVVPLRCDVHSWMSGWIFVTDHPYHAVTGDSGQFALTGIPPGTYTLEVWHETLGRKQQEVEVKPAEETTVEFQLSQGQS